MGDDCSIWFGAVLTVLVIAVHSVNLHMLEGGSQAFGAAFSVLSYIERFFGEELGQIAVPGFFFMSGYLFSRGLSGRRITVTDIKGKWGRRIFSLVIPYLLWNLIYYVIYLAFGEAELPAPKIVGLAKREETIVLDDFSEKLLPRTDEGLRLLQRLRDEAHRFANSFSRDLRSKKIRESILDDFPSLGKKRKENLLKHFGSISKIKSATAGQLAEVECIGRETAEALRKFLDANFPEYAGGKAENG